MITLEEIISIRWQIGIRLGMWSQVGWFLTGFSSALRYAQLSEELEDIELLLGMADVLQEITDPVFANLLEKS